MEHPRALSCRFDHLERPLGLARQPHHVDVAVCLGEDVCAHGRELQASGDDDGRLVNRRRRCERERLRQAQCARLRVQPCGCLVEERQEGTRLGVVELHRVAELEDAGPLLPGARRPHQRAADEQRRTRRGQLRDRCARARLRQLIDERLRERGVRVESEPRRETPGAQHRHVQRNPFALPVEREARGRARSVARAQIPLPHVAVRAVGAGQAGRRVGAISAVFA